MSIPYPTDRTTVSLRIQLSDRDHVTSTVPEWVAMIRREIVKALPEVMVGMQIRGYEIVHSETDFKKGIHWYSLIVTLEPNYMDEEPPEEQTERANFIQIHRTSFKPKDWLPKTRI